MQIIKHKIEKFESINYIILKIITLFIIGYLRTR